MAEKKGGPPVQTVAYHCLSVEDTLERLNSDFNDGLCEKTVNEHRLKYGYNELSGQSGVSPWKVLLRQVMNALIFVLIIAMVVAFAFEDYIEGGVIALVVVTNTLVGFFQEYRAEKTMESLRQMASPTSQVIRSGQSTTISTRDLVPGDIVIIKMGDVVGADCRLIEEFNLQIDEALLTGESMPVSKCLDTIELENEPLGDRINMGYSSTTVTKGRGRAVVTAIGMQSEIGKIAKTLMETDGEGKTPLQKRLDVMALFLFGLSLVLSVVVFAVNKFKVDKDIVIYCISLAIAVIPEGMIAVVTLTMALGVRRMAESKALVRQLSALEAIGSVTNICSDKTGTLTQAKMILARAWLPGDGYYRVTGQGIKPEGTVYQQGDTSGEVHDSETDEVTIDKNTMSSSFKNLVQCASLCNLAIIKKGVEGDSEAWEGIGDPTEIALQVFAHKMEMGKPGLIATPTNSSTPVVVERASSELNPGSLFQLLAEFPFDSSIKRMSVVYQDAFSGARYAYLKGATERVLPCCSMASNGTDSVPITEEFTVMLEERIKYMASKGLRVLSLAYRNLKEPEFETKLPSEWSRESVDHDMIFLGLVGIYDQPRPESMPSVLECYQAGITVHMLTGDHPETGAAIAREVHIIPPFSESLDPNTVMTAQAFDALTDAEIDAMPNLPRVIARCSPETKVKMIRALHRRDCIVAMTGDGVNDSPSLKSANIGIAMGQAGSDVAKQASNIVLTDDNFATIVRAVAEGRRIFNNIRKFILHLLSGNFAVIMTLMIGLACVDESGVSVYPMSPVQILFFNMITSSPPAMALGLEKATPDTMRCAPQPVKTALFSFEVILDICVYGFLMGAMSLGNFMIVVYGYGDGNLGHECNDRYSEACDTVFRARGAAFGTLSILILLHAYNCRRLRRAQWGLAGIRQFYQNKALFWSVFLGIGVTVPTLYIPYVNEEMFRQRPLTWEWLYVGISMFLFLVGSELFKFCKRRFMQPLLVKVTDEHNHLELQEVFTLS